MTCGRCVCLMVVDVARLVVVIPVCWGFCVRWLFVVVGVVVVVIVVDVVVGVVVGGGGFVVVVVVVVVVDVVVFFVSLFCVC